MYSPNNEQLDTLNETITSDLQFFIKPLKYVCVKAGLNFV